MLVNLTSFSLTYRKMNPYEPKGYFICQIEFTVEGDTSYPTTFDFYSQATLDQFCRQLIRECPSEEAVAFIDDASILAPYNSGNGFRFITLGEKYVRRVVFPGVHVARWIRGNEVYNGQRRTMSTESIWALKRAVRPKTMLVFEGDVAQESMKGVQKTPAWASLRRCISQTMWGLRNGSDGKLHTLHVMEDSNQDSFYFWEEVGGQTVFTGGWIRHAYADGTLYYQTHT